ncbi:SHQ1-like [Sigmodon hispidus]
MQQAAGSSPEPSDSDSATSSDTEDSESDSASEQEELAGTQSSLHTSLQAPLLAEDSALLIQDSGLCRNMASMRCEVHQGQTSAFTRAPLIEEVGEELRTTLQVSTPHGVNAGSHSSVQDGEERGQVTHD